MERTCTKGLFSQVDSFVCCCFFFFFYNPKGEDLSYFFQEVFSLKHWNAEIESFLKNKAMISLLDRGLFWVVYLSFIHSIWVRIEGVMLEEAKLDWNNLNCFLYIRGSACYASSQRGPRLRGGGSNIEDSNIRWTLPSRASGHCSVILTDHMLLPSLAIKSLENLHAHMPNAPDNRH